MHKHADYVPLHLHSEYSLLDGAIKISELVETSKKWNLPAVAITDHGNMFGAVQFYKSMTKADLKPIIGSELYVAPKSRLDKQKATTAAGPSPKEESPFHLVALAKDNNGYKNLTELVSRAYTEGFYYRPRVDKELLEQYSGGLIFLSACMKGEVAYYLSLDMKDKAREAALFYKHIAGPENYYIELQENGVPAQTDLNKKLLELARELHINVVATNDCHYLRREDARAHDILLCIGTGKTVNDASRLKFQGDGLYFRSPEEMKQAFADLPEAIRNTVEIAERCNVEMKLKGHHLPMFRPETGETPEEYLEKLAQEGLLRHFKGATPPEEYAARLQTELSVIKKMGFSSYFLIVWDFINNARKKGIPVGPGRGSAAGSLVSYSLGITELDPIRYDLLFERFLNPERISMPDVDTDFCRDRRQEIIDYVSNKYGRDHVAQIITFGTLGAKAAIRDVGRAMDIPYAEVDKIAKLVPEGPNVTIKDAISVEPQLKELYENGEQVKELIDIAQRLEGLSRHASTHAAGIVISPQPLTALAPLYRNPSDGSITTQFDMGSIDSLGLVKFDFLGLKTLTVINKAVKFINDNGTELDISALPLDDLKTFQLLGAGQSTGVFQFESSGMKELLIKMGPERFEDLVALNALYRPGPLGSGMVTDFIDRKKGRLPVEYDLPQLEPILKETYGIILYQEQVMRIAHDLAGFTLGQADMLRRAMGKKKPEEMEKQKESFVSGSVQRGIPAEKAKKLFDLMAKFAEYGFNKSHSAAYAYVAYQTAYLKTHFPVEFMAAMMSVDLDNTDKIMVYIRECQGMGIKVLPPDINVSEREFKVTGRAIRFGMGALKGAGAQAVDDIIEARGDKPFNSFSDFMQRVNSKKVNKKILEALIKAGAFDTLCITRKACFEQAAAGGKERAFNQTSIFGDDIGGDIMGDSLQPAPAKSAQEWDMADLLAYEKEALGFYISGNPMQRFSRAGLLRETANSTKLNTMPNNAEVSVAGIVASIKKIKTKSDKGLMASMVLDGEDGQIEVIVFPDLYKEKSELVAKNTPVLAKGTVEANDKGTRVRAKQLQHLEELFAARPASNGKLELEVLEGADLNRLAAAVMENRGKTALFLRLESGGLEVLLETSCKITADDAFYAAVSGLIKNG